jgi:fructokinase
MFHDYLWGIDLGGTKIEGVLLRLSEQPEVLLRKRVPTRADQGYEAVLASIMDLVNQLSSISEINPVKIGVGVPGVTDRRTKLHKNSNAQCLNGKPLLDDLHRKLGIEVLLANDSNCFALAEAKLGAAKNSGTSFGMILGTGVGGGIVVQDRVLEGINSIAGEWGHCVLEPHGELCYCGKRGCIEQVISGPALERYYQKLTGSVMPLPQIMMKAEEENDQAAQAVLARLIDGFGRAVAYIINILDPEYIVLGGGVSNISALYSEGVQRARQEVFTDSLETKIVKNGLGDSAGVLGAALLTNRSTS